MRPIDLFRRNESRGARERSDLPAVPSDPYAAGQLLLALDVRSASAIFQQYSTAHQRAIIEATPDPYDREELYYLVPDCTELVRASRVESLLEIINTSIGTGLACGILSAVSPEQFAEMFERTAVRDGLVDRDMVILWVAELTELEPEELTNLLTRLDIELVAELFRGRVDVPNRFKGMAIDSGMIELEHVDFEDEQSRLMGELLWSADPGILIAALRLLLTEREESGRPVEEGVPDDDTVESSEPEQDDDRLATLDLTRLDSILPPVRRASHGNGSSHGTPNA